MWPLQRFVVKVWCTDVSKCSLLVLPSLKYPPPSSRPCYYLYSCSSFTNIGDSSSKNVIVQINKLMSAHIVTMDTRSELQTCVGYLQKQGFSITEIVQSANIVKEPHSDTLELFDKTKNSTFTKIDLLKLLSSEPPRSFDITVEFRDMISLLTSELVISHQQAINILKRHKFLRHTEVMELLKRISYLKESGVPSSEIYTNITALKNSVTELQDLIEMINSFKSAGYITQDFKFAPWLRRTPCPVKFKRKTHWTLLPIRSEAFMEILDVSKNDLQTVNYWMKIGLDRAISQIQLLKNHGYNGRDIINGYYILNPSYKLVKDALAHATKCGIDQPTISDLHHYILNKKFPRVTGSPRQHAFLAAKLNMTCKELRKIIPHNQMVERLTLNNNLDFLLQKGFSLKDLRDFPIILCHKTECLKYYTRSLAERPELQPFEQFSQDKSLLLNSIQYYIEKSVHFSGAAYVTDPEEDREHEPDEDSELKQGGGV